MTPSRRSTMLLVYSGLVGALALRPSSPPSPKYGQLASKRTRPTAFRCNERSFHYKICKERTFHYIQSIKDTTGLRRRPRRHYLRRRPGLELANSIAQRPEGVIRDVG